MFKSHSNRIRAGGKVVGVVQGNRFCKSVRGSRHMLREPKGWAMDAESLADAERLGARVVEVHDIENGIIYSAPVGQVLAKGFRFERGFGPQICLPLQLWDIQRKDAQQLALWVAND